MTTNIQCCSQTESGKNMPDDVSKARLRRMKTDLKMH